MSTSMQEHMAMTDESARGEETLIAPLFVPPSMMDDLREVHIATRLSEIRPMPVVLKEMTGSAVLQLIEGFDPMIRAEIDRVTGIASQKIAEMAKHCAERGDPMVSYRTEMHGNTMRITAVTQSQMYP